jgi:phenylalanine-4-hydroxylase
MDKRFAIEQIPDHLKPYIAKQDPTLYTAIDHASWRYILKISQSFFAKHAHQKYLDGLKETGISTERIPLIQEMDQCLRKFGWQAVPVSGFIPPAAFMEFLSLGVLPIACDMRKLENLSYTPAPDIVHEAAGHAPIIADPEYSAYLRSYGEISQKAIYSLQDINVYHAIRHLSDTKENPSSTAEEVQSAQERLNQAIKEVTFVSEATLLSRMGWWTFEYGLVGGLSQPKIYGAGLLSSLGESYHCFDSSVNKIPFSIECVETTYDITKPQPQLYVAPDFQVLKDALEELSSRMAFRRGGIEGLEKAKQAATTITVVLDSGTQMSGTLQDFIRDAHGKPCYLKFSGPTQIAYQGRELDGQGAQYHRSGFGTPLENITEAQLVQANLEPGKKGRLDFRSGVQLEGKLVRMVHHDGKLVLLTWKDCSVKKGAEWLFRPEWGFYDMVCAETVVSVFGGAADRKRYQEAVGETKQDSSFQKSNLTEANRALNDLYAQVRKLRELGDWGPAQIRQLESIYQKIEKEYDQDWLLSYEILEIIQKFGLHLACEIGIRKRLQNLTKQLPEQAETILRGLEIL